MKLKRIGIKWVNLLMKSAKSTFQTSMTRTLWTNTLVITFKTWVVIRNWFSQNRGRRVMAVTMRWELDWIVEQLLAVQCWTVTFRTITTHLEQLICKILIVITDILALHQTKMPLRMHSRPASKVVRAFLTWILQPQVLATEVEIGKSHLYK